MTEQLLSETLHQLMHSYTDLLNEGIKRQNIALSVTQIRTLKWVFYHPDSTVRSISESMQRDKAQITRALNGLLAADLIVKQKKPQDGRSQLLQLTAKGEEVMAKLDAVEDWAKKQLTQNMTHADIELFLRISRLMIGNVKNNRVFDWLN